MKVAVVGLGKMGLVHTGILNILPDVELVAVCEKSRLIRGFLKKAFKNVPILNNTDKLSRFDLDAVYVTTPIPSHFNVVKTVLAQKITRNVFVEKTLAANYPEAKELRDLSVGFPGVNMVGYLRRFYVTFKQAKNLLEREAIGEIRSFTAYAFSSDFADNLNSDANSVVRGGVLNDLGCYAMDLALWFFGDLEVRPLETNELFGKHNEREIYRFQLNRTNQITGSCEVSWCMKDYRMPEVGFSIEGSRGVLDVNDDKVEYRPRDGEVRRWLRHDLEDNVQFWLAAPEYFREDAYYIDCVSQKLKAEPNFESASKVDKIIEEVKRNSQLDD